MSTKSTGRGGAGNIGAEEKKNAYQGSSGKEFETPHIRQDRYTTGRGGTGNIAKYDKERPEIARAAQDVTGPIKGPEARGESMHYGRGGEGNVSKGKDAEKGKTKATEGEAEGKEDSLSPVTSNTEKPERVASPSLLSMAKEKVRRYSSNKKETK